MVAAIKMVHAEDPRETILAQTKQYVDNMQVLGARVLLATYIRPEKTAGGIILTSKSRDEDDYQGKVGLVLKLGPIAFTEDSEHVWGGVTPKVGDWVLVNIGDVRRLQVGQNPCRFVHDVNVQAILQDPDAVW